jgi:hypothetical protein
MSFLRKNKYFLTCCFLLVGLTIVSVYEPSSWIPTAEFREVDVGGTKYNLAEYPHISNELIGLYNYFRDIIFSQDVNSFDNMEPSIAGLPLSFGPGDDAGLRYILAFNTYAMAEMMKTTPGYRDPKYYQNTTDWMIQKMEAPKVKAYWNVSGQPRYDGKSYYQYTVDYYGVPPGDYEGMNYTNIMYRAHLILMQAMYQYLFDDPKYNFTLTQQCDMLFDEMTNKSNPTHTTPGVPCEPVELFVQCNTINSLVFKMYDDALSESPTNYYSAAERLLEWELDNMTNADGLFVNGINVSKFVSGDPNYVLFDDSGYTQGWSIAFINAYNETVAQALYPKFKDVYVKDALYPGIFGDFALVVEYANAEPLSTNLMDLAWSIVSSGFGIMAAKEMGDQATLNKIQNWINFLVPGVWDGNKYYHPTPLLEGLKYAANMILYWGMQGPWVNLGNFTQRNAPSFWTQPYIVDVTDVDNIFINQAFYDESNSAFMLTASAAVPGNITLTNASGGTVYSARNSGYEVHPNSPNITIAVERGSHNFVIQF